VRTLLCLGRSTGATITCAIGGVEQQVGGNHGIDTAAGYATIDLVASCAPFHALDDRYFDEILYDNVLIGDYQNIVSEGEQAFTGGGTLVHIRAIPEGGGAGSVPFGVTRLPFTFYDRYTIGRVDRRVDRRQPLPSTFAARWLAGHLSAFEAWFRIWREGIVDADARCDEYTLNSSFLFEEIVRFDERENAFVTPVGQFYPYPSTLLPAAARVPVTSSIIPVSISFDAGGWVYMNLNATTGLRDVSQNWVTVTQLSHATGYASESDAIALGNGCSPASRPSYAGRIAPAGGVLPCPPGTAPTNGNIALCTGTNTNP
jgi:hypothetical protein